ncbi:hypothetical protein HZC30_08115 [Candidatus Woesearchaeota archaeon]|nr:hypothetical protein [Candidatus Woesearchaeota archaeon]
MTNLTLSVPEELHERMIQHSEIRWSEVVRKSILDKIELLEAMDKLAQKSRLTKKDVEEIAHKINKEVYEELNRR